MQLYISQMLNYFMRHNDNQPLSKFIDVTGEKKGEDSDDEDSSTDDDGLEDDMESLDSTSSSFHTLPEKLGSEIEIAWKKRSKALRTDVAIAGWMCSPNPEIMEDCYKYHTGEHRTATTRLYKKWFGLDVSCTNILS